MRAILLKNFYFLFFVSFRNPRETNERKILRGYAKREEFWGNLRIYLFKKTFVALIEKQLYYVNGRKHNSSLFLLDLIDFLTTSHKKKGYEMKFKFFLRIRQRW